MWIKLDDHFPEHRKLFAAARELGGANASGRVLAVFIEGLCFAARNLTDGFLPSQIVRKLHHDPRPIEVAHVLAKPEICLWHPVEGGWQIHDYDHYNPPANVLKTKREKDRERKRTGHKSPANSARNPDGIQMESVRNPERSRARDPVPVPGVLDSTVGTTSDDQASSIKKQKPAPARSASSAPVASTDRAWGRPTAPLLAKLILEVLEANPHLAESDHGYADLVDELKSKAASLYLAYDVPTFNRAVQLAIMQRGVRNHEPD